LENLADQNNKIFNDRKVYPERVQRTNANLIREMITNTNLIREMIIARFKVELDKANSTK
jgi:hypothetical protein